MLRHITRIQVRNFTPFPARDAFASALTQPSEQSQFTSYGSLSDDLDVALARKRTRRTSSASMVSVKSQGLEDYANEESRTSSGLLAEQRVRKRTISRVSAREFPTSVGPGSHPPLSGTVIASKSNHPRTVSAMSSTSGKGTAPTIILWQTYTQRLLEKVLQSRLVETLITVAVPSPVEQPSPPAKPSTPAPSSRDRHPSPRASPASKSKHSPHNSSSKSTLGSREEQSAKRVSRTGTTKSNDSLAPTPATPNRRGVTSSTKLNGNASKSVPPASQVKANPETRNVPNFISGVHRPSTNPDFSLDLHDFSKWTDPSATHISVQLWARLPPDSPSAQGNEKGKEKMSDGVDTFDPQWRIAGKWDICLADLIPFPDEVSSSQFQQEPFRKRCTADVSPTVQSAIECAAADTFATGQDVLLASGSVTRTYPFAISFEWL